MCPFRWFLFQTACCKRLPSPRGFAFISSLGQFASDHGRSSFDSRFCRDWILMQAPSSRGNSAAHLGRFWCPFPKDGRKATVMSESSPHYVFPSSATLSRSPTFCHHNLARSTPGTFGFYDHLTRHEFSMEVGSTKLCSEPHSTPCLELAPRQVPTWNQQRRITQRCSGGGNDDLWEMEVCKAQRAKHKHVR